MTDKALLQLQAGKQTDFDTAVDPTVKFMAVESAEFEPIVEAEIFEDETGDLTPGHEAATTEVSAKGNVEGRVTFQDLSYWFDSLFSEATPSGADPYEYDHAAPLSANPTPRIQSLVRGFGSDTYGMVGAIAKDIEISGATKEPVRYKTALLGKNITGDALAVLSDRAVKSALSHHVSFYIDDWDGTVGTTVLPSIAYGFSLKLDSGREVKHGLGSLLPKGWRKPKYKGTLTLTLEFDADSKAIVDAILAAADTVGKVIRISITNGDETIDLDFAGKCLTSPKLWDDEDGVLTTEFEFSALYNPTMGNWFISKISNHVASLV